MIGCKKEKNILFVNNSPVYLKNGHNSVFLGLLSAINKYNLNQKLNIYVASLNWNIDDEIGDQIRNLVNEYTLGEIRFLISKRLLPRNVFIFQVFRILKNMIFILYLSLKYHIDTIFAYTQTGSILSLPTTIILNKKMLFHWCSDAESELLYLSACFFNKVRAKLMRVVEFLSVKFSNHVFCVSALAVKKLSRYISIKHISQIPNAVNSNRFFWDIKTYKNSINSMKLDNRFVVVYSGTLRKYQRIDKMLDVFKRILQCVPEALFLFLSPDSAKKIQYYFEQFNIPNRNYRILSVSPNMLAKYLTVGNVGFLLRGNNYLNRVAWPTKFAEYLACGVPVMITRSLGEQSLIVEKYGLGVVIEDLEDNCEIDNKIAIILNRFQGNIKAKEKCSSFAQKYLSWNTYVPRIFDRV